MGREKVKVKVLFIHQSMPISSQKMKPKVTLQSDYPLRGKRLPYPSKHMRRQMRNLF
jgi:hypothetical protein